MIRLSLPADVQVVATQSLRQSMIRIHPRSASKPATYTRRNAVPSTDIPLWSGCRRPSPERALKTTCITGPSGVEWNWIG